MPSYRLLCKGLMSCIGIRTYRRWRYSTCAKTCMIQASRVVFRLGLKSWRTDVCPREGRASYPCCSHRSCQDVLTDVRSRPTIVVNVGGGYEVQRVSGLYSSLSSKYLTLLSTSIFCISITILSNMRRFRHVKVLLSQCDIVSRRRRMIASGRHLERSQNHARSGLCSARRQCTFTTGA